MFSLDELHKVHAWRPLEGSLTFHIVDGDALNCFPPDAAPLVAPLLQDIGNAGEAGYSLHARAPN